MHNSGIAMSFGSIFSMFTTLGIEYGATKFIAEYNAQQRFSLSYAVYRFCVKIAAVNGVYWWLLRASESVPFWENS